MSFCIIVFVLLCKDINIFLTTKLFFTFFQNRGKLFYIEDRENRSSFQLFPVLGNSRKNKQKLDIGNEELNIECDDLSLIADDNEYVQESTDLETIYSKSSKNSSISSMSSDSNSELNYSSEEGCDDDDESDDEEDDEDDDESDESDDDNDDELFGYINNFPIQMICMEKCDGTLDDLFVNEEVDEKKGASILFQVVMILLIYQKMFSFTHNDLHTNNIMYETTTITHIYYIFNNVQYKVPTYGRIFKLIDFGRSIVTYNNTIYCSDSFKQDGDANTQYNFGPFYDQTKKCINPNYSFDLCRLGCSIYDFIIDDEENIDNFDDFQKLIYEWCCDDSGKNILYKKNGDERYPNFKLYKMIARIVHNHTPEKQLEREIFKKYQTHDSPKTMDCVINIDNIPSFA